MSYDLLNVVTRVLTVAGIPTQEAYPPQEWSQVDSPRAVVGLRELDPGTGTARFRVQLLSPRLMGGWCCQVWAAQAVRVLHDAGLSCRTEEMEYLSGSDCFCVAVEAVMPVVRRAEAWEQGTHWRVFCGGSMEQGVISFTAAQDRQRRLVGAHWKSEPVGITSGSGGWRLELVQQVRAEPPDVTEPFVLRVWDGEREHHYTGCCWNETVWEYTQSGSRLVRRGFALGREEVSNG